MNTPIDDLPVAVIGAGPVGLAAAAHLSGRGLPFSVLEAGSRPAAAVTEWGHIQLFTPWRYCIDEAARRLLLDARWVEPDLAALPTGAQLVADYLQPLAALPALKPHLHHEAKVVAVTRLGLDRVRTAGRDTTPFLIQLADGSEILARAVIDASGTWRTPNPLGGSGIPAVGEAAAGGYVDRAMPDVLGADRDRFARRRTVVVGSGHSAANSLLLLAELAGQEPGTSVVWVIRSASPDRVFSAVAGAAQSARDAIGARLREYVESGTIELVAEFSVRSVTVTPDGVELCDGGRTLRADRIVSATGFRPDHTVAAELRLDLDPVLGSTRALAPLIDPNVHSCYTTPVHGVDELSHPEPGYHTIGVKSYGRAPTFLLSTGYGQARSVVAALAGDWAAARDSGPAQDSSTACGNAAASGCAPASSSVDSCGTSTVDSAAAGCGTCS